MPIFKRYIGIDYSGAKNSNSRLKNLCVYMAEGSEAPKAVQPLSKDWSRREVAYWLVEQLGGSNSMIIGIDHGFSFPIEYFKFYGLEYDWPSFLDDFQCHWPTDKASTSVASVRKRVDGDGAARTGEYRWYRETEKRTRAKSVFNFGVPGQVAYSTHAGIPWLRFIRNQHPDRVHFWPFDGWDIPLGKSAIVEAYPALWSHEFSTKKLTSDQHDAFTIAAWLARTDQWGTLRAYLNPELSPEECNLAKVEGWIIGVAPSR